MSIQQHPAATALLADPSLQAAPEHGFNVVARGYHRGEVDEWRHWALSEIEGLTRRVSSFAVHEASSPEGQRLIAELIQIAADEITGQQAAAAAEIEQMIAGAHQQADEIIGQARQQADQHITSATQQAASLVNSARADAKRTTDDASAHAAAVHEAAGERLAQFAKVHQDGLLRMAQMNQVTRDYLAAEEARGSLAEEVDKALAAVRR
jgi:cell division septum initiation protein DivIVA